MKFLIRVETSGYSTYAERVKFLIHVDLSGDNNSVDRVKFLIPVDLSESTPGSPICTLSCLLL